MPRIAASLLLALLAGCGGPRVAPVSGVVTLGQKPLANAVVIFEPFSDAKAPGPGSQGKTDAAGRYSLSLVTTDAPGAIVGKHKVSITAYDGDDTAVPSSGSDFRPFRKRLIPDEFNANTTLTFEVPAGGSKDANFDLPAAK